MALFSDLISHLRLRAEWSIGYAQRLKRQEYPVAAVAHPRPEDIGVEQPFDRRVRRRKINAK
ncbi:hypothetical protein [Sphingobium fuliginis]|jgi:hypothetical protein|uniref:hypothetical protein n=1 Tax=Sphingobium fuliginis (strain ATCC 27551) TaxID=336203 RepID=UPI00123BBB8B